MSTHGRNEGFHVLDEFVCEAVHAPTVPLASPDRRGRNGGFHVVDEMVFDASSGPPDELNATLKSEVERLAVAISATNNPVGVLAAVQKMLTAELAGHQRGR